MISFSSTSGDSGVSVISITATSNSDFNSIIKDYTLTNSSGYSLPIAIAQKGTTTEEPYIVLDKNSLSFPSSGGSNTISVMSNRNWKWDMDEWIGHSIDGGTTGSTLIGLRVAENTGSTKNGTITAWTIPADVLEVSVSATTTVSQAGNYVEKDIKISPSAFTFDYVATGGTISITANTEWNIYSDARWITLSAASGSGNTAITFTITANEQSNSRNAIIYVADLNESIVRSCNLIQNGAAVSEPYLLVSPTGATVPLSGGTVVFTVSSNTEWDVYMDDVRSWVTLDNLNGYGNGEVTARVEPYNYDGTRSVGIKFINEIEELKSEVTITQEDIVENNKIYYKSSDGNVVTPYSSNTFGDAVIVSNTYVNGQGVIELDRDVTVIGNRAFSGTTLTEIKIPSSVYYIGLYAFRSTALREIKFPSSVTTIKRELCSGCTYLSSVTIPNSITKIPNGAFKGCISLSSITIPNSVTTINNDAFNGCTGLTSITLSNSISAISAYMFYNCRSLSSITIPSSVTSIGNSAFTYCQSINELYMYPTTPPTIGNDSFLGVRSTGTIHCPVGSQPSYFYWRPNVGSNWTVVADLAAQVEESE